MVIRAQGERHRREEKDAAAHHAKTMTSINRLKQDLDRITQKASLQKDVTIH